MKYQITVLTFDEPIPTGNSGSGRFAPFANRNTYLPIEDLGSAKESTILLEDDDSTFNSKNSNLDKTGQTLTEDTVFGNSAQAMPAGTRLTSYFSSRIRDSQGNDFRVMFPAEYSGSGRGTELGNRHSILVFPEAKEQDDGTLAYPTFDKTESFKFVGTVSVDPADNAAPSYPPAVPCFTTGTLIETPSGPRPIETLRVGDMVTTRDHGPRRIAWIGQRHVDRHMLDLCPNLRPVLIRAGALGPDQPNRDLTVSPQHRVLVKSQIAERMFDHDEILVAAKHLTQNPAIEVLNPEGGITYWHMLFDDHELLLSNGTWTESLFTGPQAMHAIGEAARHEILSLFPQLAQPDYHPQSARRLLSGREGRKLAERHAKNGKPLVSR